MISDAAYLNSIYTPLQPAAESAAAQPVSRESRGFFDRMDHWLNKDKQQNKQINLSGSFANNRPSYSRVTYDDYYDDDYPLTNRRVGGNSRADHYASPSGHGEYCEEDRISIGLLIISMLGIGIMWYVLLTKIQANGGRRRKRELVDDLDTNFDPIYVMKNSSVLLDSVLNGKR
jgi:hypothetical protein